MTDTSQRPPLPVSWMDIPKPSRSHAMVIRSAREAERWLRAMARAGLSYHPDDDPSTVVTDDNGQTVRLFTDFAARGLGFLMEDCRKYLGDRVYTVGVKVAAAWEEAHR